MSTEKYASLHSGLIARKGEALPTPHPPADPQPVFETVRSPSPASSPPRPQTVNCDLPAGASKPKRPARITEESKADGMKALTFRLDPALYHRVQVAAAKLGWTSQDLLRAAVEGHLVHLGTEIFPNCGCIGGREGCN
ncbi:MAG: hypothetical protein EXR08_03470 [Alphaproteobacteria bacterium]|nr:hypothetical protein [Alphaproteobacteria bacterium]